MLSNKILFRILIDLYRFLIRDSETVVSRLLFTLKNIANSLHTYSSKSKNAVKT